MNISRSTLVFPSYNKIKQQIIDKENRQKQDKMNRLVSKFNVMNQKNNFVQDHAKIKDFILAMAAQKCYQKNNEEKEVIYWQKTRNINYHNQQSINYFIEDDKEEENNYQSYLKFKKKALQRDLQEDKPDKLTSKERKKQQQQEQELFRNLYVLDKNMENKFYHSKSTKKINKFQYGKMKENATSFIKRIDKNPTSQKKLGNVKGTSQKADNELKTYQKNKKYLIQNYMDILKKMQGTNIVKWRILNKSTAIE